MLVDAYRHADVRESLLAEFATLGLLAGVLAATVREAQAGDADALAALLVLAPDMIPQHTTDAGALHGG